MIVVSYSVCPYQSLPPYSIFDRHGWGLPEWSPLRDTTKNRPQVDENTIRVEVVRGEKHSELQRYIISYGRKKLDSRGPRCCRVFVSQIFNLNVKMV